MSVQNVRDPTICLRRVAQSLTAGAVQCWRRMIACRDVSARKVISEIDICRQDSPLLTRASHKVRLGAGSATVYGIRGKHTANPPGPWTGYGASSIWDQEVDKAITKAVELIDTGSLTATNMFDHFVGVRRDIAQLRGNKEARVFGMRRDNPNNTGEYNGWLNTLCTALRDDYKYALGRALTLHYDDVHYVPEAGNAYCHTISASCKKPDSLRFGLVKGMINGRSVNLTQYVFTPPQPASPLFNELFGADTYDFEHIWPYGPVSAIWVHPEVHVFPACMQHIEALIERALAGDLSVIPRIHWWSVHLSATWRGSGGIAEIMIKTLCRYHGCDLPPWREGVAPSVEALLQPDEELFCSRYGELFAGPVAFTCTQIP